MATSTQETLQQACAQLEQGRCLATELEAWQVWNASLLRADEEAVPNQLDDLPGGVQDAWSAVSSSQPGDLGSGQYAKALRTRLIAGSLQQTTQTAQKLVSQPAFPKLPPTTDFLKIYDERLQQLRSYHATHAMPPTKRLRKGHPIADGYDLSATVVQMVADLDPDSSEVLGKYLDLQGLYQMVVQQKVLQECLGLPQPCAYIDFLEHLELKGPTEATKLSNRKVYAQWLTELQTYLRSFLQRTVPLLKIKEDVEQPALEQLANEWKATGGWKPRWKPIEAEKDLASTDTSQHIDLADYATVEDLTKAWSADQLKVELARLGLKCGGTPDDRAKRLWSTKGKSREDWPSKILAKGSTTSRYELVQLECAVLALLDYLRPTVEATMRRTERRQTQTLREREQETQEELYGTEAEGKKRKAEEDDEDDDDAPIYNPKNVPLDWDGKPIPYWLFKLHGLNHYYPCEICGGESYRGKRNFELHFADQKHALGMKGLGIPNTKHFHGVTKIEDAQELWSKLQSQLETERFVGTRDEEYEDSHGNVLSRKAYEDLARQGLL